MTHDARTTDSRPAEARASTAVPGKPPRPEQLVDVHKLVTAYYAEHPSTDPDSNQLVSFGTSGHRGSSFARTFNEDHILAVTQAICDYRKSMGITGPLFLGRDTHALSEPAYITALEVLAANGVETMLDRDGGYVPTPALSHAILTFQRDHAGVLADGIVITPSHNPPEDGGFKYNPPNGGPAEPETTTWIAREANAHLASGLSRVHRIPLSAARAASTTHGYDYVGAYVRELGTVLDMEAIRGAGVRIGVDPLGGAAVAYWDRIAERYGLALEVVNKSVDPTFRFMTLDWDGKIRMDCSSKDAMAGLIALKGRFDVAFGNDTDVDRHGIVTPRAERGLLNPNHYLAVAVWYLFRNRPGWARDAAVGKTVVSSSIIDRVASEILKRDLVEVPVGFKHFVKGLRDGSLGFGGEESAGASFLRKDGTVWTTDKDGIILGLLAAEIRAKEGKDPAEIYADLTAKLGRPIYERIDQKATKAQKEAILQMDPEDVEEKELAGSKIEAKLTSAPGNGESIGGLKVVTKEGWFAARPSGTEEVYKIYSESFVGKEHLVRIQDEARSILKKVFQRAGVPV
jgi:phosphoglucomutase